MSSLCSPGLWAASPGGWEPRGSRGKVRGGLRRALGGEQQGTERGTGTRSPRGPFRLMPLPRGALRWARSGSGRSSGPEQSCPAPLRRNQCSGRSSFLPRGNRPARRAVLRGHSLCCVPSLPWWPLLGVSPHVTARGTPAWGRGIFSTPRNRQTLQCQVRDVFWVFLRTPVAAEAWVCWALARALQGASVVCSARYFSQNPMGQPPQRLGR